MAENDFQEQINDYTSAREEPPVGVTSLWGPGLKKPLPVLSHYFQMDAYKATEELLNKFEDRKFRGANTELLGCIGIWFMAMESGISAIYKILSLTHDLSALRTLPEKFGKMPSIVGQDIIPSKLQINEVQEFCCFRNALFHDLYDEKSKTEYSHTKFACVPAYANEIDLIEAARISLNSLSFYRWAIQGNSLIENSQDITVKFQEYIVPKFMDVMESKGYTKIDFRPFDNLEVPILTPYPYKPIIKF